MRLPQRVRERRRGHGAHHRLREGAVEREVDLGYPCGRGEAAFVRGVVTAERADVVERARLAAHHPLAGNEVGPDRVLRLRLEHRLVEARWQHVDEVDVARELVVLLARHATRDKIPRLPTDSWMG